MSPESPCVVKRNPPTFHKIKLYTQYVEILVQVLGNFCLFTLSDDEYITLFRSAQDWANSNPTFIVAYMPDLHELIFHIGGVAIHAHDRGDAALLANLRAQKASSSSTDELGEVLQNLSSRIVEEKRKFGL